MFPSLLPLPVSSFGQHQQYQPLQAVHGVERPEKRLIYIPGLFLLLRIWGTVQLFYSLAVPNHNGCIQEGVLIGFKVLGYLQVRVLLLTFTHVHPFSTPDTLTPFVLLSFPFFHIHHHRQ